MMTSLVQVKTTLVRLLYLMTVFSDWFSCLYEFEECVLWVVLLRGLYAENNISRKKHAVSMEAV
jgi:hypothetical protein